MIRYAIRAVSLVFLSWFMASCAPSQMARQESADQIFGKAKVAMNLATVGIGAYNVLCISMVIPEGACVGNIRELVNSNMANAADAIARTEKVFAAGNVEGTKLDYAKLATAAVVELTDALAKYGISNLSKSDARIAELESLRIVPPRGLY